MSRLTCIARHGHRMSRYQLTAGILVAQGISFQDPDIEKE